MKLKEFSLWGFKLELSESRKFTLFNRSVCAHFERHFQSIDTENIYRVIVKLSEPDERENTTEESSSVLKYYKSFDFNSFFELDENSKQKFLLDVLYQSLIELCDKHGWPKEPFIEAYNLVLKDEFINVYEFKKKNSRNRKLVAKLECNHNSTSFDCFLKVVDKSGEEICSKLLFSEEPDEFIFNSLLGDVKWIDDETVAVLKKDKSEVERIKLEI